MPKKADGFLLAALLLLALFPFAFFPSKAGSGCTAVIKSGNQTVAELPLDTDAVYELPHNTVTIKDGRVFVSAADCPDGICLAHTPTDTAGDAIVCLPNRVIVEVRA